jgi:DNA-directed RNA polymerase specialized sigma24 family protein
MELASLSDDELLASTADKPEAFGVFYERHARAVLSFVARECGDTERALDVTAEVFAAAQDESAPLPPRTSASAASAAAPVRATSRPS